MPPIDIINILSKAKTTEIHCAICVADRLRFVNSGHFGGFRPTPIVICLSAALCIVAK